MFNIITFLLFIPVLNLLLPLKLFMLLLIIGILSLGIFAHLTVVPLLNPVLNLTLSLLPITSSHSNAMQRLRFDLDYRRYINISLYLIDTDIEISQYESCDVRRRGQSVLAAASTAIKLSLPPSPLLQGGVSTAVVYQSCWEPLPDLLLYTLCSEKNTHSHFLSYLHELFVDLNKNCSEYTQGLTDSDNVKIRYSLRSMT